jgi:hypothetical protein
MKKFFNTAGPCKSGIHYFIDRSNSFGHLVDLVHNQKYFIHHAPRQTGKTTLLIDFCKRLNEKGQFLGLYVNIEAAQTCRQDVLQANRVVIEAIQNRQLLTFGEQGIFEVGFEGGYSFHSLQTYLSRWALKSSKPIVLILDEIDSLVGDSLVNILRQIRAGYDARPEAFPQSIILNGVRDLRDYRIYSKAEDTWLTGGSCFNIKSESVRLENFSMEMVQDLFEQHSNEHSQKFENGVVEEVFRLTQGQPWLCNALGEQLCFHIGKDKKLLNLEDLIDAREALILRRDTHIDQLYAKLDEERVRDIVMPLLWGEEPKQPPMEDVQYCIDLGLLKNSRSFEIANPIYQEVLPRELAHVRSMSVVAKPVDFINNNKLDFPRLLQKFTDFYRENAQEKFFYNEITPHILLMAFLQRIINGGGQIIREYALGSKRMDIGVIYGSDKFAIEIKIKGQEKSREQSLDQIGSYMDSMDLKDNGYLLVFSRDFSDGWQSRFKETQVQHDGRTILVLEL